jgi:hypothetical protein
MRSCRAPVLSLVAFLAIPGLAAAQESVSEDEIAEAIALGKARRRPDAKRAFRRGGGWRSGIVRLYPQPCVMARRAIASDEFWRRRGAAVPPADACPPSAAIRRVRGQTVRESGCVGAVQRGR